MKSGTTQSGCCGCATITRPILARHGVHIERWLMTETMVGTGLEKPDQIPVTWFESAAAKEAFENDPDL